ncbi:MAG: hypothetical protein Q9201_006064 [Fulgogasparrea decipioides]
MNQATFQNMSGQTMGPQAGPQPAPPNNNGFNVQQQIVRALTQQVAPQGWQSSVPMQYRGSIIFQLFSSLRLLHSNYDNQHQLQLALNFEGKAFMESADKNTYEKICKRKLGDIQDMRTKQSLGMQQQINMQMNAPQPMQNMTQNMVQRQQNPQQQQMMSNHGLPMQQQPQPPGHQLHNMPMGHSQAAMSQQQVPPPAQIGQQPNQYTPTAQENQYITQIARQLFQHTSRERLEAITNSLRQMNPEQRENLARQGIEPLHWYFRNQAMKKFMELKRGQAGNLGNPAAQAAGMVNGMPRPMPQNAGRPPGQQAPAPQQSFEPPFDQIFGQQQDGLRSQEAGQVVVPASNSQANLDQRNAARPSQQHQMNMPHGANRAIPNIAANNQQSQPVWNAQRNMNQPSGISGTTQAGNFPNPSQAPSNVLQGQPGGLDNQIMRTPSQTPDMPNLNKAAGPPGQTSNLWQSKTPQTNQTNQTNPQSISMAPQTGQQAIKRSEAPPQRPPFQNMSIQMQQHLASLPEDQRQPFLLNLQRRHYQQQQRQQEQIQQAQQQSGKAVNAGAAINESFPMATQASQPGMQARPTGPIPNQNTPVQPSMMQQSNLQQPPFPQQASAFGGPARQQPGTGQGPPHQRGPSQLHGPIANAPLTEEQARQIDQKPFPATILSRASPLAQIPKEVKTWGQLKEFAAKHAHSLPPGTLGKLINLQAMQYRQLQGPKHTQPAAVPTGIAQQQAPFAQMVSQPNNQGPVPAPQSLSTMTVAQPSYQDIQTMRNNLPPHLKTVPDEQIRQFIITKQRENALAKSMQAQQAQNSQAMNGMPNGQQSLQIQIQGSMGQSEVTPNALSGQSKASMQSHQKVTDSPVNQSTRQGQGARNAATTKQPQKGGNKRSTNEDVVEVPNPNLTNPQARTQTHKPAQATKQRPSSQAQEQKAHTDDKGQSIEAGSASNQPQNVETQGPQIPTLPNISKEELARRDARLKALLAEIGQNALTRNTVTMSAEDKKEMTRKLHELSQMVIRMEKSFLTFFRNHPDENTTRRLIQTRNIIKAQYKDADFNVKDQLTITPNELDVAYNHIRNYFAFVMSKFSKRNNASQAGEQAQAQSQPQPQPQQPAQSQEKAPLNAANLREQQNALQAQRAAAMQRHHSGYGSRVPAAPTSDKPPFPLGPQSPHGFPQLYGPTTLTADQLVLPQPKRRKSNNHQASTGSTPVPAQETPRAKSSPLNPKLASPEVQRTFVPQMSFKCSVSNCQSGQQGFTTQVELEQHNAAAHAPEEPVIDDPFEFALDSMRLALGLDENGKSKPQHETLEAPRMKASLSAQSHTAIKQEVSTPMARAATQTGPSPASQLKTPQASSNLKSPASDGRATAQEGKGKNGKGPATPLREPTPPPFDPWAGSSISSEAISSAWSSLADMQSLSFTKMQMGLTPSSTLSSGIDKSEKNSPRASDISENDAVKINIDVGNEDKDNWIPSDWFDDCLYGDIESLNFDLDNVMGDAGWDLFGQSADTVMVDTDAAGGSAGKGKKREQDVVPEEWLKVYAPEKLAAKKGR